MIDNQISEPDFLPDFLPDYLKVVIKGKLICQSELHIGGGEVLNNDIIKRDQTKKNKTKQTQCCVKGIDDKAYIPGSTLKGLLKSIGESFFSQDVLFFGDKNGASRLTCYDAFTQAKIIERSRTSIDPVTNTARNHMLYTYETIPKGSEFSVKIQLNNVSKDELTIFLNLLSCWNGIRDFAIGKNKSTGSGLLDWQFEENNAVQVLTIENFKKWLLSNEVGRPSVETIKYNSEQLFSIQENYESYSFIITQDNCPLLINDSEKVTNEEKDPNFEYIRDENNNPFIPGSTLKGALRSHMRKILFTLYDDKELVEKAIESIFGCTNQSGLINLTNAWVSLGSQHVAHIQFFNIIDRFSGATNNLYHANAIVNGYYEGKIILNKKINEQLWAKELLLLTCKDFEFGDLVLGWGKARGYGRCLMEMSRPDDFYYTCELSHLKKIVEEKLNLEMSTTNKEVSHA